MITKYKYFAKLKNLSNKYLAKDTRSLQEIKNSASIKHSRDSVINDFQNKDKDKTIKKQQLNKKSNTDQEQNIFSDIKQSLEKNKNILKENLHYQKNSKYGNIFNHKSQIKDYKRKRALLSELISKLNSPLLTMPNKTIASNNYKLNFPNCTNFSNNSLVEFNIKEANLNQNKILQEFCILNPEKICQHAFKLSNDKNLKKENEKFKEKLLGRHLINNHFSFYDILDNQFDKETSQVTYTKPFCEIQTTFFSPSGNNTDQTLYKTDHLISNSSNDKKSYSTFYNNASLNIKEDLNYSMNTHNLLQKTEMPKQNHLNSNIPNQIKNGDLKKLSKHQCRNNNFKFKTLTIKPAK